MIPKLRAHVFTVIFPIFKKGIEPSSFYGSSRISCHSRLPEAVRKVDIEKRTATEAIIGSLDGGKNRDIEIGSENDMRYTYCGTTRWNCWGSWRVYEESGDESE